MPEATGPLQGLRVLDLADEKAELCGRLLADFGADVIRVEPPDGARSRRLPPFAPDGTSIYFAHRNTNKRGIVADLHSDAGRETIKALAADADVIVETFRPGTLAAMGLGAETLRVANPALVVTSVTDFGQTGPYKDFVGTNLTGVATGGILFHSGSADREPLAAPGALAYDIAGVVAAFATLAAYYKRLQTGQGQHLDVSVLESVAQTSDWTVPNASAGGFAEYGNIRSGSGPVYPIYPCADGYVRCIILSPRQWHAMRAWLGEPDHLQDPHWDSILGRLGATDVIDPLYIELFSRYKKQDLAAEGQKRGIPITPVLSPSEVLECEHFAERGTFVRTELADGITGQAHSGFFEFDGRRQGIRTRAPNLGEHDGAGWDGPPRAVPAPETGLRPPQPFAGLRVLDFGIGGVGVEAARLLGEYGADVIKVETRTYPDFIRTVAGSEMSPSFASSNRSKRGLGVNLRTNEGRAVVERLVAQSDVVIENSHTGGMASIGFSYERLNELNPRIVMMSSQMMGSRGPWSGWTGYGPSTRPASGVTWLWNYPDTDEPPGSRAIFPDHLAGRLGALAAAAGIVARETGGLGVHAEVAQIEATIGTVADLMFKESIDPGSVRPLANANPVAVPWGVYQCDGEEQWCAICVRDDADWANLRSALGDPDWARAAEYSTARGRVGARVEIDAKLGQWTRDKNAAWVMETLQAHGVPAGRMNYPYHVIDDRQFVARGYPRRITQPGVAAPIVLEGPSFRGSDLPDVVTFPAPGLGEHTREICSSLLGMEDDEIDRLLQAGVLEGPAT